MHMYICMYVYIPPNSACTMGFSIVVRGSEREYSIAGDR